MSVAVYTQQSQQLLLTTEIGRGGEGTIYASPFNKLECAKIYGKALSPENYRKLELMVADPPRDPAYDARKHRSISWPVSLLYRDPTRSECVGFLMPTVDIRAFRKAILYLDPSDRSRLFGGSFNWKYLYTAAFNIVSSIAAIHERNYCIGDINESNVLLAANALITLIDCDSFQVPDPTTGKVYRCPVGKAEYTAPELQGKSYNDVDRTQESDCFALAVLLFQLLMEGTHPYQAKGKLVEDAPSPQSKIIKGYFPYTMQIRGIAPPDHAPPFEILHPEIQQLFHRSFSDGHRDPRARPTAFEWFEVLKKFGTAFRQCPVNPNHVFLNHLGSCPWCQIKRTKGKDLFPSPVGQQIALDDPSVNIDSLDKRIGYLRTYVLMALADGVLTPEEESYLVALGSKLQIPPKEIEKTIQVEGRKVKVPVVSSGGGTPRLEISKSQFEFQNLRTGATAHGTFVISNAGGGILQGSIKSNRHWLMPVQAQIDTTRHRQEISFQIDTAGLPLGFKERGHIEVRSNGGTEIVAADLSVEIPDVALGRFRGGLFWLGFFGGGLFGYVLYQLLPANGSRDVVVGLAGWIGIIAAIVVGSRTGGFAGGCAAFFLGPAILGSLQKFWPEAFSTLSWAITHGTLLHTTSRALFISKHTGNRTAVLGVSLGAIGLCLAIILAGILLGGQVVPPNQQTQVRPLPQRQTQIPAPGRQPIPPAISQTPLLSPLQPGIVATCVEVRGWKDYIPKNEFHPGDGVCVYAEALNVNQGGRVDVSFLAQILDTNGNAMGQKHGRHSGELPYPHVYHWDRVSLPLYASPGTYVAVVDLRNNLTGQTGRGSVNFTVLPPERQTPSAPVIASVTPILPQANQTITITGSGFGNQAPYNGNSPYIMISDVTRNWNAGNSQLGCLVTLNIIRWTDTEIMIEGFTGAYGGGWSLNPGDLVLIQIWNAQSGAGPATISVTAQWQSQGGLELTVADLAGKWEGAVNQPNYGSYPVRIGFEASGVARIAYPTLDCGGSLVFLGQIGNRFLFRQKLEYGQTKCVNGGRVDVRKPTNNSLDFQWFFPNGTWGASATLVAAADAE